MTVEFTREIPTVQALLATAADRYQDAAFLQFIRNGQVEERSYRTVKAHSSAVCRWLRHRFGTGLHIAVVSRTSYDYITFVTGVLMSGNVVVPFAPEIAEKEAAMLFHRADVDLVLHDASFADAAARIASQDPRIRLTIDLDDPAVTEEIYRDYADDSPYAALSAQPVDPNA